MAAQGGALPLDVFMAQALGHPAFGYYMTRDPFGARGDFITAPEVSQVFGELIGAWAAHVWMQMGHPEKFNLIELGPGRGTLMEDALRATAKIPGFHSAMELYLVETSPVLMEMQKQRLSAFNPVWLADIAALTYETPCVFIANEFFDALPVKQFEKTADGWMERFVTFGEGFEWFSVPADVSLPDDAPEGSIFEISPAGMDIAGEIAGRVKACGGAALIIDYGFEGPAFGDTLQALKAHEFVNPLADPGEADITAHVDFTALAQTALATGCEVHGPIEQGGFLTMLGIFQRAEALKKNADEKQKNDIDAAVQRLTAPDQMGRLFKVMAFTAAGQPVPEGFA